MILIGVSPGLLYPDNKRPFFGPKQLVYLENDMACYLTQKNVFPVLIPDLPQQQFEGLLERCAGFVLQGGSDISPKTYGAKPLDELRWPGDHRRDALEYKIIDFAVKRSRPLLGICRGCQLINVFFGGTLYQDLPTERPHSIEHKNSEKYDNLFHDVTILPDGYLADIYHRETITVNSVHHQGIKNLAPGFRIESVSKEDGLIEAISKEDDHFILGVQWHPEFSHTLQKKLSDPQKIIDLLIQKVTPYESH